jgi:hypothetical protein
MAFSFPVIVAATDVLLTKVNLLITKLNSVLNSFPGDALAASSVAPTKLTKPKAEQLIHLNKSGALAFTAASQTGVWQEMGLATDGGAITRTITGWTFSVDGGGTLTKGANNTLLVQVNGVTQITIDLNDASLALAVPISATALAISWPSGQILAVNYVYGGVAGRYDNPQLVLQVETAHVG